MLFGAIDSTRRHLQTARGRNVMLYLGCVVVSFVFWMVVSLDGQTERDYEMPVEITNVPDSVTLVGNVPTTISVAIKGKGTQFLKYHFGKTPTFTIDFRQYSSSSSNYVWLTRSKIDSRLRDIFGQGVSIIAVNPDSIKVGYSTGRGERLPLVVKADVSPSAQSVISGPVTAAVDSVTVFTMGDKPVKLKNIETELLVRHNIGDTTVCEVRVKQPAGMRVKPETVKVTIPAELLVSKKRTVMIGSRNVPANARMFTFPASAEISYLVPMRLSNNEIPVEVYVDYMTVRTGGRRAKVNVSDLPGEYRIVSVSVDSVEYVIER